MKATDTLATLDKFLKKRDGLDKVRASQTGRQARNLGSSGRIRTCCHQGSTNTFFAVRASCAFRVHMAARVFHADLRDVLRSTSTVGQIGILIVHPVPDTARIYAPGA
eukprot:4944548-Pyramimonas_sp.AAC.1